MAESEKEIAFLYEEIYKINSENIYKNVAANINKIRISKNLSVRELALLADISERYLTYIESGKKHATLLTLKKLALALDVNISYLLGEIND